MDAIIFRGNPTGTRAEVLAPFLLDTKNPNLDFSLITSVQDRLTVKELVKFKYFLVLPGNDVSTGLKWMLSVASESQHAARAKNGVFLRQ